jgi:hypothetical protein
MQSDDYGKELWSLANLVTGFFIAQFIAVSLSLGKDLDDLAKKPIAFKITISLIAVTFAIFYCCALRACRQLARSIDHDRKHDAIWAQVNAWRIAFILLFTSLFVFALFEHDIAFLH